MKYRGERVLHDDSTGETFTQWVHKEINIMKNVYSQEHFINLCKLVVENSNN